MPAALSKLPWLNQTPVSQKNNTSEYFVNGIKSSKEEFAHLAQFLEKGFGSLAQKITKDHFISRDELVSLFDLNSDQTLAQKEVTTFLKMRYPFFKDMKKFTELKGVLEKFDFVLHEEIKEEPFPKHFSDIKIFIPQMEQDIDFAIKLLRKFSLFDEDAGREKAVAFLASQSPKLMGNKDFILKLLPLGAYYRESFLRFAAPELRKDPEVVAKAVKVRPGSSSLKYAHPDFKSDPELLMWDEDPRSIASLAYFGVNLALGAGIVEGVPSFGVGFNLEAGTRFFGLNGFYYYLKGSEDRQRPSKIQIAGAEPRLNLFKPIEDVPNYLIGNEQYYTAHILAQLGFPFGFYGGSQERESEFFCGGSLNFNLGAGYYDPSKKMNLGVQLFGISTKFLITPFSKDLNFTTIFQADLSPLLLYLPFHSELEGIGSG